MIKEKEVGPLSYFLDTVGTIPDGLGFAMFDGTHLAWLAFFVLFAVASSLFYRRSGEDRRRVIRYVFAALLVADELFKDVCLILGGNFSADYLPLHLCSVNIFLIAYHVFRKNETLDNFLYIVCIPGAAAAMLAPTWTELPFGNFMHMHSFTVHTLLAVYPIMLTAGGDIKPNLRRLPRCLLVLGGLALVALGANLLLDTNFMFLMYAEAGNPLYWFEVNWGSHLLGFPVLIAAIVLVMNLPWVLARKWHKKAQKV